jgi:hypothetical protein
MRCLSGRNFSLVSYYFADVYYALEPNKLGDPVAWLPTCKCSYFQLEPRGLWGVVARLVEGCVVPRWFPVTSSSYQLMAACRSKVFSRADPASGPPCQLVGCQCGRPSSFFFFFYRVIFFRCCPLTIKNGWSQHQHVLRSYAQCVFNDRQCLRHSHTVGSLVANRATLH